MRWLAVLGVVVGLAACGGGSTATAPPTTLPGDLVPAGASAATVTVGSTTTAVPAAVVAKVLPLLVRRVFDAREPLAGYGLDAPRATISFAATDGTTTVLRVGAEEFDKTATYVQRDGDGRIWLVLDESLAPLLEAAGAS